MKRNENLQYQIYLKSTINKNNMKIYEKVYENIRKI